MYEWLEQEMSKACFYVGGEGRGLGGSVEGEIWDRLGGGVCEDEEVEDEEGEDENEEGG